MSRRYSKYAMTYDAKMSELTDAQKARIEGITVRLGLEFSETLYDILDGVMSHRVQYEERMRPDLIAWKWYDDPHKWEFILEFNEIDDYLTELKAGDELLIPVNLAKAKVRPQTYLGVVD